MPQEKELFEVNFMKKNRILQTVLVAVLAACTLFFGFIGVLACIPETAELEAVETVRASASKLMADEGYRIDVVGRVKNTTEKTLVVDGLEILLTDDSGETERVLTTEKLTILPKNTVDVAVSAETDVAFDTVKQVTGLVNGETITLKNAQDVSLATALIPLIVTAVFAFFLVRACKVRYYMMQEDRADEQEASAPSTADDHAEEKKNITND